MQPQADQPPTADTPQAPDAEVHSAGTVITPNGAATPPPEVVPPAPAPITAEASTQTTPPLPTPPTQEPVAPPAQNPGLGPVPPPSNGPVSQAEFLALAKKKRRPKLILKIAIPSVVLVAILAGLHFSGVFPLTKFKTVTFDNGTNSTYKLTFYSKYKTESAGSSELGISESTKALVSQTSSGGQAPLKLFISDTDSKAAGSSFEGLEDCAGAEPAVKAYNKAAKTDVNICDIGGEGESADYLYMALYKDEDRMVVAVIMSSAFNEKAISDPDKAKDLLKTAKLDVYNDDIAKIVGSIEIVPAD